MPNAHAVSLSYSYLLVRHHQLVDLTSACANRRPAAPPVGRRPLAVRRPPPAPSPRGASGAASSECRASLPAPAVVNMLASCLMKSRTAPMPARPRDGRHRHLGPKVI
jgi:hypothetical protein